MALAIIALLTTGCTIPVLKQDIPVSTNPLGAKIYANGQFVGTTPTTVSLERNRSHILTLLKENYQQQDVVIQRQYQSNKVFTDAILTGINSGLFFKDANMGMNSGMNSISRQEQSGEAYLLVPPAVAVVLVPLAELPLGVPPATGAGSPPQQACPPGGAARPPPANR